jgi:cob(I)alamin adenosyltransferase
MSRLYTKTGDNGLTSLYDMRLCKKDNIVFSVLGSLDELSAHIGMVCTLMDNNESSHVLRIIQNRLLDVGSDVATVKNRKRIKEINEEDLSFIETYIDEMDSKSPKLTEFILPGYTPIDSQLHICRSVCRRLEREMWQWWNLNKEAEEVLADSEIENRIQTKVQTLRYINRLSDFFFAMARVFSEGKEITRTQANQMAESMK